MDWNRLTPGKWLIVVVAIAAVLSMIVVVYQTTRPPATPEIDPQFSRGKMQGKSRDRGPGNQPADATPQGASTTKK